MEKIRSECCHQTKLLGPERILNYCADCPLRAEHNDMADLIDEDGENRAVRAFLMVYGVAALSVGVMKDHMRRSGYDGMWPEWADEQHGEHLTKGGAQHWLRHLFALEAAAGVKGPEHEGE